MYGILLGVALTGIPFVFMIILVYVISSTPTSKEIVKYSELPEKNVKFDRPIDMCIFNDSEDRVGELQAYVQKPDHIITAEDVLLAYGKPDIILDKDGYTIRPNGEDTIIANNISGIIYEVAVGTLARFSFKDGILHRGILII